MLKYRKFITNLESYLFFDRDKKLPEFILPKIFNFYDIDIIKLDVQRYECNRKITKFKEKMEQLEHYSRYYILSCHFVILNLKINGLF